MNDTLRIHDKPKDEMEKIAQYFTPYISDKCHVKYQRITTNGKNNLLFLSYGEMIIINDSEFYSKVKAPFILGFSGCFGFDIPIQVLALKNSKISLINSEIASSVFTNNSLWKEVCACMSYNNYLLSLVTGNFRTPTKSTYYRIVKAIEFISFLQKHQNENLLLAKEIMTLTSLSRSVVMKTLSNLRHSGVIIVENGVLVSFDRSKI